jgi:hypothetical protein
MYSKGVEGLYSAFSRELQREARKQGLPLEGTDYINQLANLIESSYQKNGEKVVVIIDEYDKPLINTMNNPSLHIRMREELKGFYGVLKSYDEYLRFVLLTGVTKFSHVSVFSDLNHLMDLTLDPLYADICGITQKEVEKNFEPEIAEILENTGKTREIYLEELRRFYNGYRFTRKPLTVFNPFGLLNHFNQRGDFQPYWYSTGTPTFLVNLIITQKVNILDLHNMQVTYDDFSTYDIETMRAEPLLYQSGYLTIVDYNEERNRFTLDYPNEEVRSCFAKSLLKQYLQVSKEQEKSLSMTLPDALEDGEIAKAIEILRIYFASIPYDIIKQTENYYQTAIHLIFMIFGHNCRSELRIASGRIDTLVETAHFVYCFEFKLDGSAEAALAQINSKEYLLPWTGSGKKLFKVAVVFDTKKRTIGDWKVE